MENTNQKRSTKRTVVGVAVLLLAVAMLFGSLFAYFSDKVEGDVILTAGNLDIEGSLGTTKDAYIISRWIENDWVVFDGTAESDEIINPGDIFKLEIGVENEGSKSAWVQSNVNVTYGADGQAVEMAENVKFYSKFEGNTLSEPITLESGKIPFEDQVINGTVEEEDASGENGTKLEETYYFQFESGAGNTLQEATIGLDIKIYAIQYRNNANPAWDTEFKEA